MRRDSWLCTPKANGGGQSNANIPYVAKKAASFTPHHPLKQLLNNRNDDVFAKQSSSNLAKRSVNACTALTHMDK